MAELEAKHAKERAREEAERAKEEAERIQREADRKLEMAAAEYELCDTESDCDKMSDFRYDKLKPMLKDTEEQAPVSIDSAKTTVSTDKPSFSGTKLIK